MKKLPKIGLLLLLKIVILGLAFFATYKVAAIFHLRDAGIVAGLVFIAVALLLYIAFRRIFPSVYGRPHSTHRVRGTKRMFYSAGDVVAYAQDVAAAKRWYSEKLGLHYFSNKGQKIGIAAGYSDKAIVVYLVQISAGEKPGNQSPRSPIMFAWRLADAHEYLSSKNVNVSPIQKDYSGNPFFRFRDLEGNEIEVCKEP